MAAVRTILSSQENIWAQYSAGGELLKPAALEQLHVPALDILSENGRTKW
jgi:hypothetical protein